MSLVLYYGKGFRDNISYTFTQTVSAHDSHIPSSRRLCTGCDADHQDDNTSHWRFQLDSEHTVWDQHLRKPQHVTRRTMFHTAYPVGTVARIGGTGCDVQSAATECSTRMRSHPESGSSTHSTVSAPSISQIYPRDSWTVMFSRRLQNERAIVRGIH